MGSSHSTPSPRPLVIRLLPLRACILSYVRSLSPLSPLLEG
jgi:hypothetical protein